MPLCFQGIFVFGNWMPRNFPSWQFRTRDPSFQVSVLSFHPRHVCQFTWPLVARWWSFVAKPTSPGRAKATYFSFPFAICQAIACRQRLWCVVELFVFLEMGGSLENLEVIILPDPENRIANTIDTFDPSNLQCSQAQTAVPWQFDQ